jgi:hypothetical protein
MCNLKKTNMDSVKHRIETKINGDLEDLNVNMNSKEENTPTRIQKMLWWCSGANSYILKDFKSDWHRFYSIGLVLITISVISSFIYFELAYSIFTNVPLALIFCILLGVQVFILNRYIVSTIPELNRIKNILSVLSRIFISLIISITTSFPLQLIIFKDSIEQKILTSNLGSSNNIVTKFSALEMIRSENISFSILYWFVIILFVVIEMSPLFIILLTRQEGYEEGLVINSARQLLKMQQENEIQIELNHLKKSEIEIYKLKERKEIEIAQNHEEIEKELSFLHEQKLFERKKYEVELETELAMLQKRKEIELIKHIEDYEIEMNRFEYNERIESANLKFRNHLDLLKQEFGVQERKREKQDVIPYGGFEFYIDYKSLLLNDINLIFSTLNDLYNVIYKINGVDVNNHLFNSLDYNMNEIFKTHPEDVLCIHSMETGNSVTFKISTGWKPKVELINGDFIVSLPKGSLALFIAGFLIVKMFDYGVSSYKQILEIQKLEKENKALDNKALNENLNTFNVKYESVPIEVKNDFQKELGKFYKLTIGNSNFIHTKITQDKLFIEKISKNNTFSE